MRIALLAALLVATACTTQEKVDRPTLDTVPNGKVEKPKKHPKDTLIVDSAQASVFRHASYGASVAADSSVYKLSWRFGTFATGDTAQVKLVRDSVAGKVKRVSITKNRFTATGSVDIGVDKVFGTQASYSACTRQRKTAVKSEVCVAWKTNFPAKPPADSMWVDSTLAIARLDIKPDNPTVETGKQIQFCPYIVFRNNKVALRTQDKATPKCDEMYKEFTLTQRDITIKQQQVADSVCIKWEATGGNITAETCGPPNPLTNQKLSVGDLMQGDYYIDHQMSPEIGHIISAAILGSVR